MSSPVNNFLTLIPASHRVAVISTLGQSGNEEVIVPVLQKTRRSSSSATADSNTAEEPSLPVDSEVVTSPTESEEPVAPVTVGQPVGLHGFLRLGN